MKRVICTGEIITAAMWNENIRCNDLLTRELQVASAKVAELGAANAEVNVAGVATLAMVASATTVPITRRQLFGFLDRRRR